MNSRRIISALLLLLVPVGISMAQKTLRYENLYNRNLWLQGNNVAGMRADSLNASVADIAASFRHNGFRQTWEAKNQWSVCAEASTLIHLKKFSMEGSFSFTQTMLYNACGSMFNNPGYFPVDIAEFTPGTKSRQRYFMDGGISVDLSPSIRVGGRFSFNSVNCAKRKDIRYTNYLMNLNVRPCFQWHGDKGALGATFIFERNTETITCEQIGESLIPYEAFLDKGLFYGVQTVWDGAALHISEDGISGFPVREMCYGASIQGSWKGLYSEFTFVHGKGKVGEKDAIWFDFPSNRFEGTIAYKFSSSKGSEHIFRLDASYRKNDLWESIIEKTTTGGVTTRTTYGSNAILTRGNFTITPSWKGFHAGVWEADAQISYSQRNALGTQQYPAFVSQSLQSASICANGRYIDGNWSVLANVGFLKGWLNEEMGKDSSARDITPLSSLTRYQDCFNAWEQYETSFRCRLGAGLRYDWVKGLFVQLSAGCELIRSHTRADAVFKFGIEF